MSNFNELSLEVLLSPQGSQFSELSVNVLVQRPFPTTNRGVFNELSAEVLVAKKDVFFYEMSVEVLRPGALPVARRFNELCAEVLLKPQGSQFSAVNVEVLRSSRNPNIMRDAWISTDVLTSWTLTPPGMQVNEIFLESTTGTTEAPLQVPLIFTEVLLSAVGTGSNDGSNEQGEYIVPSATSIFPTLIGLGWSVHKVPGFSTKTSTHSNGVEVRTAQQDMPKWEYQLTYDYLPDRGDSPNTDLKTIQGFFLMRRGSYENFLYKDVDDHLVVGNTDITPDGVSTLFYLTRNLSGFSEIIGQLVDGSLSVHVENHVQSGSVASGPYTFTLNRGANRAISQVRVNALITGWQTLTLTTGAPNSLQYTFDGTTVTVNSTYNGRPIEVTYDYDGVEGGDYAVVMPNQINFVEAPGAGEVIETTFEFWFVCRFLEDTMDFEKFMDKLWNLNECNFISQV